MHLGVCWSHLKRVLETDELAKTWLESFAIYYDDKEAGEREIS
jgi:hypothetical protein